MRTSRAERRRILEAILVAVPTTANRVYLILYPTHAAHETDRGKYRQPKSRVRYGGS